MHVYARKDQKLYLGHNGLHGGAGPDGSIGQNNVKKHKMKVFTNKTGLDKEDISVLYIGDDEKGDAQKVLDHYKFTLQWDPDTNELTGIDFTVDAEMSILVITTDVPGDRILMTNGSGKNFDPLNIIFTVQNPDGSTDTNYNKTLTMTCDFITKAEILPFEVDIINGTATIPFKPTKSGFYNVPSGTGRMENKTLHVKSVRRIEVLGKNQIVF